MKISNKNALATTGASFYIHNDDYDSVVWYSDEIEKPTLEWCKNKVAELQAVEDAQEYSRNRKDEYPDWGTQLNKIYDDGVAKWKSEMVDPIKAKWPKDNSGPK